MKNALDKKAVKKMIKNSEVKDKKEDKKMMGNVVLKDKMKKKDCKY
jgi:hypothetical protein